MKKVFAIICILVAVLLLVPHIGKYKDGGTVCYNAILYDVYDMHALYTDSDGSMRYVEGVIIEVLGYQIYNSTTPHIDDVGDSPDK